MDRGMVGDVSRGRLSVDVGREGGSVVLTPKGELDFHTADLMRDPLERTLDEGVSRIVVDCSELEFCDSTGLNVLLGARLRAEEAGGGIHLAALRPAVARVFEITGVGAVFRVHGTLAEALVE